VAHDTQSEDELRFDLVFTLVRAAVLFTVFWFAAHSGMPW
jgi:hypothetical protein